MSDGVSLIWNSVRSTVHAIYSIQDAVRLEFPSEEVRRLVQLQLENTRNNNLLKARLKNEFVDVKELSYACA